jgi:predicted acetyltransferase
VTVTVRSITADELEAVSNLDCALFGYRPTPEATAYLGMLFDLPRVICAFDGDTMVGMSAALPLELTLPGGAQVGMAGITWVGVQPTHTRQGIMRRLLMAQLDALSKHGEPIAGLMAAESLLYRRFGFGIASRCRRVEVDPRHSAQRVPFVDSGTMELVDVEAFLRHIETLHTTVRATRNGMVSISSARHRETYRRAGEEYEGAGPMQMYMHRDPAGEVDGLVSFRLAPHWENGFPDFELRVNQLFGATTVAETALWRLCLGHDLVTKVVAPGRPVDEPIADLFADPRRWVTREIDDLHVRPFEVPALLAARRYSREDALVIEVRDELFGDAGGRFHLEGGRDGAECTRTDAAADIVLGPAELGAVLLGDTAVERLWRAGLVDECTPGAVWRATAMMRWSPAPWASYMF